ncbi:pseudouridine synthase [soil metagenome]
MKSRPLVKYLAGLGYGTRREATRMLAQGRVTTATGGSVGAEWVHDDLRVNGEPLDPAPGVVLMLHKPGGYVCSTTDVNPVVYDLLPPRFLRRSPVIAPVGRLDADTTGLLLLTDDGALNHRITSPRTHLPKVYEATLAADLRGDEAEAFASGTLLLKGEQAPLMPATLEVTGPRRARITLYEGRYHQVRRMFAAVGNRVETLHRSALASLVLGDLPPGNWRVLTTGDVATLRAEIGQRCTEATRR